MFLFRLAIPLLFLPWFVADASPSNSRETGHTVTVRITDSGYLPASVTVRHGDLLRFVQMDVRAHNVEFHRAPAGARMVPEYVLPPDLITTAAEGPPLRIGPFLYSPGETYELPIDEYLPEGAYIFGCSHHAGWRGMLVVEDFDDLP